MKKTFCCAIGLTLLAAVSHASDYGTTGLIDIPSARMAPDGIFTVTGAWDGLHKSYMFTYQATPWLEATFRYTGFNDFFYWDRNYEIKARLWREQLWLPQVSVGIRDAVGTGVFGSEYVVASKGIGQWDATLGMAWGRLAGQQNITNPLGYVSDRFKQRTADTGVGGEFSFDNFFSGPNVGLFGGLAYQFKSLPVKALVEYNDDQYEFNRRGARPYTPSSPVSYGLEWEALPGITLGVSHQHGDNVSFSFSAALDTKARPARYAPPEFISSRDLPQSQLPPQINKRSWYDRLLYDVERSGLLLVAGRLSDDGSQAELIVGNKIYPLWADAIARHVALADLHLPPSVKKLYLIAEDGGHRASSVVVPRPSALPVSPDTLSRQIRVLDGADLLGPRQQTDFTTGKINITADLNNRLQLFDPDDPARYQVYVQIGAEYAISNHWALKGLYGVDITNTFDESRRKNSDSVLPKVRSDIVKYLTEGETGLDSLMLEGRDSLSSSLHYRLFGGVLEEMYTGVGGEVLYWPAQSRLAFGLSAAYVRQRAFDKSLDLLDYSVATGFVSAYWASPFYNYDAGVHVGRYLAKDLGATFELRRTFDNGWQVGLWATLTDVPFDTFGEGSFDKGFYFKIPLNGLFGSNTRSAYSTRMRPIQRDGGQRLENHSGNLFWDLRDTRFDGLVGTVGRMLP